ncbi:MAG TPA: histidine kinase [Cyclobacteriaceae bacterium]|nr:histidine kinase [Cyclobacteriaceae bacterium]
MTWFVCTGCRTRPLDYSYVALASTSFWFAMWVGNSLLADFTTSKISWTAYPVKRLFFGLVGTIVYSVLAVTLLTFAWSLVFGDWFADYSEIIIMSLIITFVLSLIIHSRAFLINWKQTLIDKEKFQKESIKAQYESLKNQVNPHFLFNSLNALTHLVYESPDKAAKFIKQLSEVYRYVLDTREKEVVSLKEELKFLESYLFLQQIRFGDNLKVEIEMDNIISGVAPLALQMLIENAIKHNEASEEHPLHIKLFAEDSSLVVENNKNKKNVLKEDSPGLGLENIRRRYAFLNSKEVTVVDNPDHFIVRLPVLNWNE